MDIRSFIEEKYDSNKFLEFITHSFGSFEVSRVDFSDDGLSESEKKNIEGFKYLGNVTLNDDREIGVFEFLSKSPNIENKRVGFNSVLKEFAKDYVLDGAIATFFHPDSNAFRLSFVGIEYDINKTEVTDLKRYTYLLGYGIPTKTAFLQLKRLKYPTYDELKEIFSVEVVSKEFYERYRNLFEKINGYIKSSGQFGYFENKETNLHYFSKKLLGRIIFLYFLQKKGWLGVSKNGSWGEGSKNFLYEQFKEFKDKNFYEEFLKKVFFEALNTKREDDFFEDIGVKMPFLNGGLFEKDEFDKKDIYLENLLFKDIFNTFNQYNFTIIEDSKDDKEVAIDPEMMGRVFENLLEENYRKGKGAFYTPREIVYYMCESAIINYLSNFFEKEYIENLVINGKTDNEYIKKEASNIKEELLEIKIADIAIGSGAFPMGMLQTIVAILENLDKTLDDTKKAKLKREIIENSIFGVDIDPSAVEIAKLRFWLSLVVDENEPFPLPNLYYKIMVGNSLFETVYGIDLLKKGDGLFDEKEEKIEEIQKLIHKFYNENNKEKKDRLKNKIENLIDDILLKEIEKQEKIIKSNLNNKSVLEGLSKKQSEHIQKAYDVISILEKIKHHPTTEIFFYKIYFGEVLKSGGFDVVIGNPPYIRQESIKEIKDRLEAEGYECFTGTADIYIYFFEKGFNLLSKDGNLSYITSNKYTRTKYGAKFREFLLKNCDILEYIDFNGVKVFESATVDTAILSFSKKQNRDNFLVYCDVKGDYRKEQNLYNYIQNHKTNYPQSTLNKDTFSFASLEELKIKEQIEKVGTPLKKWDIRIYRGILTGFNEAFIINKDTKDKLIKEDPKSSELIKPLLKGKDIKRYRYKFKNIYLINSHNNPPVNVKRDYPAIYKHLLQYEEKLKKRYDKGDNWWNLRNCAYLEEFEKDKIIYPETSQNVNFYFDIKKFFIDKTAFMITGKELKYIYALISSRLLTTYFKNYCGGAILGNKGYQYNKHALEKLPIPQISKELQKPFEILIDIIQELVSKDDNRAKFFEKVIDVMVYELYFEKELKEEGFGILDIVSKDLEITRDLNELFEKWSNRKHKVKYNLEFIDTLDIVKTIKGLS